MLAECKSVDSNTYKMFLQDDFINKEKAFADKSRVSLVTNKMGSKLNLLATVGKEQSDKKATQKIECELMS
jgi:hypothetical protein